MFDWLGDIIGGIFGSGEKGILSSLFSKVGTAAFNSLAGTPKPSGLMRPRSILEGTERRREYSGGSPTPNSTGTAGAASYDEIQLKWERRMARIMNKNATTSLDA